VGLIRDARARFAAAAAIGACVLAVAGCGGDGNDSSSPTQTGVQLQAPTTPTAPDSQGNPPGTDTDRGSTATTPFQGQPGNANPPGVARIRRALGPFRDCVSRHGVDLDGFRSGAREQFPDPDARQKRIQAMIDCIPELPPRLRAAAERVKQRYEQRQGGSG
jgi:hypothetical protein